MCLGLVGMTALFGHVRKLSLRYAHCSREAKSHRISETARDVCCCCSLPFLSLNSEVNPIIGERVACATVFPTLVHVSTDTSAVLPPTLAAVFRLRGFQ